jgi:hypothetical protein
MTVANLSHRSYDRPSYALTFDEAITIDEALADPSRDLAFQVEQRPGYRPANDGAIISEEGYFFTVRRDTDEAFNVTKGRYTPIQYDATLRNVAEMFGEVGATLVHAKAYDGGARMIAIGKLPTRFNVLPQNDEGDPVGNYILVTTAHDGTSALHVRFLSMHGGIVVSVPVGRRAWSAKAKHTANFSSTIALGVNLMAGSQRYWEDLRKAFQLQASTVASREDVTSFVGAMFPGEGKGCHAKRKRETLSEVIQREGAAEQGDISRWTLYRAACVYAQGEGATRGNKGNSQRDALLHERGAKTVRERAFNVLSHERIESPEERKAAEKAAKAQAQQKVEV